MRMRRTWLAVTVGLLVTGCGDVVEDAKDHLSTTWSCPPERVEVTKRADVDGAALYRQSVRGATPPADVAADPTRLAVFKQNEEATIERAAASFGNATIIDGRGCGKEVRLACFRRNKKSPGQPWFYCSDAPEPRKDVTQ
ncbi:MAG: hypothetical protein Q8L14_31345 [Myxococcales bacterium]|nr:hypothetical protein [Myxococcales bacterium]